MVDLGLYNYIKNALGQSRTREEITSTLLKSGNWSQEKINEAFAAVETAHISPRAVKIKDVHVYTGLGTNFPFLFALFIIIALLGFIWLDRGPQLLAQYPATRGIATFFGADAPEQEPVRPQSNSLTVESPSAATTTPTEPAAPASQPAQTRPATTPSAPAPRPAPVPVVPSVPVPASRKITVSDGKQAVLFYVNWERAAATNVAVYIKTPAGAVITEAQFDPSIISKDLSTVPANTAAIMPNLSSNIGKTVVVAKPQAGVWEYGVYNTNNLGFVEFSSQEISN